jgi:predicted dehydrogenase/threonine dehydrogenase-like Zn-dependent dehydrogenase
LRQVIQNQKTGELLIDEVPAPQLKAGGILVQNAYSLISAGTERTSVETAKASLIGKARARPDLVRQVVDNVKREGLLSTLYKVRTRLDNFKELGYSCAGQVLESSANGFSRGDRVACAGVGYASHAEVVFVPKNLAVRVPNGVSLDEAAFATVGAIALQGVRQADAHVGEHIVVVGLGLLGLVTLQLLKISGCRVFGLDISDKNFELAYRVGCDQCALSSPDSIGKIAAFTGGVGADTVLITAATTSNQPIELAAELARKKGKIVVVGAVGMDIPRSPCYEKELDFRLSCSYGPGRYDPHYEEQGQDYPLGYVRWTENRNMQTVLDLIDERKLDVASLVSHSFPVENALAAYDLITQKVTEKYVAILLKYPQHGPELSSQHVQLKAAAAPLTHASTPVLAFIGAGNHTQSYLLPPLTALNARLKTVVTSRSVNAKTVGRKFGFEACATDPGAVLRDPEINLVIVATRHDSHARYVIDALKAGKNVFVEKPLAISSEEVDQIVAVSNELLEQGRAPQLLVGYNRRYSAPIVTIKKIFQDRSSPLVMTYRVNAGVLPTTSWYRQPEHGGRLLGEICHFLDTLQFLTDSLPDSVVAWAPEDRANREQRESAIITVRFKDGSVGTVLYVTTGAIVMEKEYLEAHCDGKSVKMLDFRKVVIAAGRSEKSTSFRADKGHGEEMRRLWHGIANGQPPPISLSSLIATSRASLAVLQSLKTGSPVTIE